MFDDHLKRQLHHVYVEQRRRLRNITRRAGSAESDDLVQDAFLKVIELSQRQEVRTLDRLLAHVARRLAIDKLRRRTTKQAFMGERPGKEGTDLAANPERVTMGAQRLRRVMDVIDEMPPRRREVFLLHRMKELTYIQIARKLGISMKTVEKHMHLAMLQLSDADD